MKNKKGLKAVLVGAAGYVAPRHMKAMDDLDIELVAAHDPHDNVGILDKYFPNCEFFTSEGEEFVRWCIEYTKTEQVIDLFSICTPNYTHLHYIEMAFGMGADVICEKPLVLHMDDYDRVRRISGSENSLYCILQLREHPLVQLLKREVVRNRPKKVKFNYVAPRGKWYARSWKGDVKKSGGLIYNIGVHMFDLMVYLFGNDIGYIKSGEINQSHIATGSIMLGGTDIGWVLSTHQLPPCRSISFDGGSPMDLSNGFTELHTNVYQSIILNWGDEYDCLQNASIYRGMKLTSLVSEEYQRKLREREE